MVENGIDEIERNVEEYLGVSTDVLKEIILDKVLWIEKDNSKVCLFRVFGKRNIFLSIIQKGALYERDGEEFVFEFSIIDPWDVSGFEDVIYDSDEGLYVDQSTDEKFTDDDLLVEALQSAINGNCGKFENEFKRFLIEFNNFLNSLKGGE
ncbi:MAG: hypothetical protein RXN79_03755 [Candidatus Nanopusillus sp.]